MPKVDTKHPSYTARVGQWQRSQDCYDGEDAVKARGPLYLPHLDSHNSPGGQQLYDAYKKRALFFNATARTTDGLAGSIFQKEPKVSGVPESVVTALEDVTLAGKSIFQFALETTREVLLKGRHVVLVDFAEGADRPHLAAYDAQSFINWDTDQVNGKTAITLAMLTESKTYVEPEKDPYEKKSREVIRELFLDGGVYKQRVWARKSEDGTTGEWEVRDGSTVTPTKNGKPLDFIPLWVIGPGGVEVEPCKPPLLDLVDLNLSHYRTSADLEHVRHFLGLPTPWVSGAMPGPDGTIQLGPSGVLILDKGGQAGMLQVTGDITPLVNADESKRKMMASLGSRMLEAGGTPNETAFSVAMRHSGEHATLRTVAGSIEEAFEQILQVFAWWMPGVTTGEPSSVNVEYDLNKDFFAIKMTATELGAWVSALQANAISYETFWYALMVGDVARPGVDWEQEKKAIDAEREEAAAVNNELGMGPDGKPLPAEHPDSPMYNPNDNAVPGVNVPGRATVAGGPKQGPQGAAPKKPAAKPEGQ